MSRPTRYFLEFAEPLSGDFQGGNRFELHPFEKREIVDIAAWLVNDYPRLRGYVWRYVCRYPDASCEVIERGRT